jgi:hypothetical protein
LTSTTISCVHDVFSMSCIVDIYVIVLRMCVSVCVCVCVCMFMYLPEIY